ncbi:MAG: dihydroneopterin aldolase [Campylobacterota bacterium]|nr:dihydroneopterin aldolase [Campylobacterota bacterium]
MQIHIEELDFKCIVGLLDFERVTLQRVRVTCKLDYTYKKNTFINYAEVAQSITAQMKKEKFELLESALEHLSQYLKYHYPQIEKLYIKITKPDILDNAVVSVSEIYNYPKT